MIVLHYRYSTLRICGGEGERVGCISNHHYLNGDTTLAYKTSFKILSIHSPPSLSPFFHLAYLLSFLPSPSPLCLPSSLHAPPSPVSHPREFALDATLVRQMAELGAEQADHIRIDAFDKEKYFERLVRWPPLKTKHLCVG